jgi:ribonuclease E
MAAAPDDGEPDGAHAAPPTDGEERGEPADAGGEDIDGPRADDGGPDETGDDHRRRRRGRRGGRGRRREREDGEPDQAHADAPQAEREPVPGTPFEPPPIEVQPDAPPRPIVVEPAIEPVAVEKPANGAVTAAAAPEPAAEPPPPPAIPSTSVEAPPEKPKRGWWSRMTGN